MPSCLPFRYRSGSVPTRIEWPRRVTLRMSGGSGRLLSCNLRVTTWPKRVTRINVARYIQSSYLYGLYKVSYAGTCYMCNDSSCDSTALLRLPYKLVSDSYEYAVLCSNISRRITSTKWYIYPKTYNGIKVDNSSQKFCQAIPSARQKCKYSKLIRE